MLIIDTDKDYVLQVFFPDKGSETSDAIRGGALEALIADSRARCPEFKKMVVYEAASMEAVEIIRR